jgi:hypothetical protein
MTETYGRFAAVPIGPLLSARDSGLTLATTAAASLARVARSDIAHDSGTVGVEFAVWGDDDTAAVVGAASGTASLSAVLGDVGGIGWNLAAGTLRINGATVKTGLPAVAKGEMVGVLLEFGAELVVRLYRNGAFLYTATTALMGPLYFAASLGASKAGGLLLAANAGQWVANSPAAAAGWPLRRADVAAPALSDFDFLTAPGDLPANMRYEGLLAEGVTIMSAMDFWAWGGNASQASVADCIVNDADGVLDALALAGAAGKAVSIRQGPAAGMLADALAVGRFVIDKVEIADDGTKRLALLDAHSDLDDPITRAVFLPNISGLAWTAQPVVIGAVASVPALGANSDGSAMFLADAPVHVTDVLDRGDLMEPGTFELAPGGQQLLMKSPPDCPVVADVSSIAGGQQPATLRQALADIFTRIGKAAWSGTDADAIDAATGYAGVGYYSRDSVTARTAVAAILPSYGASMYQAPDGVLRLARVIPPESVAVPAFELGMVDLAEDLVAIPDDAPNLTRRFAYRPNAQALGTGDLVTDVVDVPQARRDELTALFRGQVYAAGPLHPHYRHADVAAPFVSLFWRAEDAQAEAERVVGLYVVMRYFYQLTVRGDQSLAPQPGQVGRITYPRYGLQTGKNVQVRSVERNPATGDVVLTVWG